MSQESPVRLVTELARLVPRPPRLDPLPPETPWQGVILARVATYAGWCLAWASSIAIVVLAVAYAAVKISQ